MVWYVWYVCMVYVWYDLYCVVAGAVATCVTYPLDLIRCQMGVNGTRFFDTAKTVLKTGGPAVSKCGGSRAKS